MLACWCLVLYLVLVALSLELRSLAVENNISILTVYVWICLNVLLWYPGIFSQPIMEQFIKAKAFFVNDVYNMPCIRGFEKG